MDSQTLLHENHDMLKSAAWNCFKKYGVTYEENLSQAYLIFMESIERYDETRGAKFSSFLFSRLRTLEDFCAKENRYINRAVPIFNSFDTFSDDGDVHLTLSGESEVLMDPFWTKFCQFVELTESISDLSADASEVYSVLVNREWTQPGNNNQPNLTKITHVMKDRNWRSCRTHKAWKELQTWFVNLNK